MGKKRGSAGADGSSNRWDSVDGWKAVEVGDEFLLGSEEYGFMGLEELDPSMIGEFLNKINALNIFNKNISAISNSGLCLIIDTGPELLFGTDAAGDGAGVVAATKETALPPKKKAKKSKNSKQDNSEPKEETVDELKARLAALEAENKALKKGKQQGSDKKEKQQQQPVEKGKKKTEAQTSKSDKPATEEKPKKKKKNKPTKKAALTCDAPGVDVSAWSDFQLDSRIMGALSKMGFSAPTHVQAECIPAAIRDRRDVIGAAQTVSKQKTKKNFLSLCFLYSIFFYYPHNIKSPISI